MNDMVKCPSCGGDGVIWTCDESGNEEEGLCWRCDGRCEVTPEDAALSQEELNEKYFSD